MYHIALYMPVDTSRSGQQVHTSQSASPNASLELDLLPQDRRTTDASGMLFYMYTYTCINMETYIYIYVYVHVYINIHTFAIPRSKPGITRRHEGFNIPRFASNISVFDWGLPAQVSAWLATERYCL